jgi:hypothetical protein
MTKAVPFKQNSQELLMVDSRRSVGNKEKLEKYSALRGCVLELFFSPSSF